MAKINQIESGTANLDDRRERDKVPLVEPSEQDFHRSGLVDWYRMERCLRAAGHNFSGTTLLDFGCGCSRILRFFGLYADTCALHGADVDREAVAWSSDHIDFATFTLVPHAPPSSYESGMFDAVYSYSVFSHLPERLHRVWLEEMYRITRPGATLVLTVHGQHVVDLVLSGKRDFGQAMAADLQANSGQLARSGFAFYPYREVALSDVRNKAHFEDWDLENYGITFILESYIESHWTDLFDIEAHYPAPDGWQDFVVLKRKSDNS